MSKQRSWSKDDIKTLRSLFPNTPNKVIAIQLHRTETCIRKKASRLRLRKSRQYMKNLRRR